MQTTSQSALKWFGKTEGTLLVVFGGDGCPFGKNESACSFLVSFLNKGKRVASRSEHFIVFDGKVQETSLHVKKCINFLCKQIADLQSRVFEINDLHVTFHFEELPNEMKMLAMLGGELSNSTTYFSSFANLTTEDCTDLKGTVGFGPLCKWKPLEYGNRIKIVKAVVSFKASLDAKHLPVKQKRSKITEFLARQKSRQELLPLVGKLIHKGHIEPLHLKNNAWGTSSKCSLTKQWQSLTFQPFSMRNLCTCSTGWLSRKSCYCTLMQIKGRSFGKKG